MRRSVLFSMLFVLMLVQFSLAQGPFGFEKGMTREQIVQIVGKVAVVHDANDAPYLLVLNTAPKPHSAFDQYILVISPKAGLLKVSAVGKTIECDSYGTDLKNAFEGVVSGISKKYGLPKDTLDGSTTDLFHEPKDWMIGLRHKDRVLEDFWKFEQPINNIRIILVEAQALTTEKGYVRVAAEFTGFSEFVDEMKAKQDENF
jgi:hypothetical protein